MYIRATDQGTLFPKDRCIVSFDGTHIAYTIKGRRGPVVALCAGFCCPDNFWRYLVPALQRKYRVLIWNYRGSGASGMPREPGYRARNYTVDDFTLDRYALDLRAILDHEGIDSVVLLGHSMGTQVCLEAYRAMPERVLALVSVTGPYASAIKTFYNRTFAPQAFHLVRRAFSVSPRVLLSWWGPVFRSSLPHPLAVALGALGSATKPDDMRPYYDHIAQLDPLVVLKMAEAMHRHTAEDVLRRVEVPALIVVGEQDNFVPPWLGHVMASRMPIAELVTVPGGTHGTIVEHPRIVNRAIGDFLDRHLGTHPKTLSLAKARRERRARAEGVDEG